MKRKLLLFVFTVFSFSFVQKVFSQGFDTVQIKTNKITDAIYMLEGAGGNIGVLVGNDGVIIIDDQFAPLSEKIKKAIGEISDKPVRFVINTHFHGDHTGGNENFGSQGAIIVAHENNRKRLSTDQFIKAFKAEMKAAPYDALPKVTFTQSLTLHLNGQTIEVFHVKSAHTDGDAIIHFKEANVWHTGDVFVRYGLPFIDVYNGGSIDGMIKGMDALIAQTNDQSTIIPGHGLLAKKKDIVDYKNMLKAIRDKVAKAMKEGKTLKQIKDSDPTKGYTATFDRGEFITWLYDSLKK